MTPPSTGLNNNEDRGTPGKAMARTVCRES